MTKVNLRFVQVKK